MSEEWWKPPCQSYGLIPIHHKDSNMVIISKWLITKGLNTEQKCSWSTTLYSENVNSKQAAKIWLY
jgi:hypothetical protein